MRTAIIGAAASMVIATVALYLPYGKWTAVLGVGLVVFLWLLSREFGLWCQRMAGAALGAVAVLNVVPALTFFGTWGDAAFGAKIEGRHWSVDLILVFASLGFAILGFLWRRSESGSGAGREQRIPGQAIQIRSSPIFTTLDRSPGAGRDQVIARRDAAGGDITKTTVNIENVYLPADPAVRALHQLPRPPDDFTGRDEELAELMNKIGTGGVTISGVRGMAGVGKTALALKLAEQLAPQYPDAQFFLDLRGAHAEQQTPLTPAEVMRHVILSCDQTRSLPEDDGALHAMYLSELQDRSALLLLDNAAGPEQLEPVIPPQGCVLLVTSRRHFALPGLAPLDLNMLEPPAARDLLLKICPRIGDHASEIAELCGHLPLALRIAASALAVRPDMAPGDYLQRLRKERLARLDGVEASITLSEALLTDERRHCLHALSVFPESLDRAAAAHVLDLDQDQADDELGALVEHSLLQWNEEARRYRMHDLVRLFADKRLEDHGRDALHLRHASFYCDLLGVADRLYREHGDQSVKGLALFDREWGNIQAGFARVSRRAPSDEQPTQLCCDYPDAGAYCLSLRQSPRERIAWLDAAVDAARRLGNAAAEATHVGNLGNVLQMRGDLDGAEAMYRKALEINEKLGRLEGVANQHGNLGYVLLTRGDLDAAVAMFRKALEIDQKLGRLEGMASAYGNLGNLLIRRGDLDGADAMLRKALEIDEKLGWLEGMAIQYGNLGIVLHMRGNLDGAETMYRKALEIDEKLGQAEGMANHYGNLGNVLKMRGDLDGATAMYRKSLEIEEKLGRLEGMGNAHGNLGSLLRARGDLAGAREHWIKSRGLFEQIGMPHMVAMVQGWLDKLPPEAE
ncbi:MAG: tetratricopeptide repeat protein [Phycisphaerales bacterium]|nr:MAG: tetratricopeptide repeat protein [Phycisphaerales bacterium]